MPPIEDHAYLKICSQLASLLSISIASARRQVEISAARDGVRDIAGRKAIAESLLQEVRSREANRDTSSGERLDQLLEALAEDENFMLED